MRYEDHRELIAEVANANGVPVGLIEELLRLEPDFANLGQPGARARLRAQVAVIIDEALRVAPEFAAR